jgi:hypothetical protein
MVNHLSAGLQNRTRSTSSIFSDKVAPKMEAAMIQKTILNPKRVRTIQSSFACIEHRFVSDGFLKRLCHHELLLYFFLVLAADRNGLSYYSYDKICSLLHLRLDQYVDARNALIDKDLIAFNGTLFQVLSLPPKQEAFK